MVWNVNIPRPRRAAVCLAWSTLLSIPLWLATLAVVKVVIVPELRAVAAQWDGKSAQSAPPGGLYARMDPHPLLRASRHEAHVVASAVMRRI
ncbi:MULTISPECIES: hypothetical protein [unclassified Sphingomonas]|uniref:hypothetical protein n=1 Tax=Novosphingobium rhizosphaerae TaxID=1551649 RepID=UPI0015C85B50